MEENALLKRIQGISSNVKSVTHVSTEPTKSYQDTQTSRPWQALTAALPMAALALGLAVSSGNAEAKGHRAHSGSHQSAKPKVAIDYFTPAYNTTLNNEGGHLITIDVKQRKGKNSELKRVFSVPVDRAEIVDTESSWNIKDQQTGDSYEVPKAPTKGLVATRSGVEVYQHLGHGIDILKASNDEIKQLYKNEFWQEDLAKASPLLAKVAFDIGVNQSVSVRNILLSKVINELTVVNELTGYKINANIGLSKADIAVMVGIEKDYPGAIVYGLSGAATERYQELGEQKKYQQYLNGWLNRAASYAKLAGSEGENSYSNLLANVKMGREALVIQKEQEKQASVLESSPTQEQSQLRIQGNPFSSKSAAMFEFNPKAVNAISSGQTAGNQAEQLESEQPTIFVR